MRRLLYFAFAILAGLSVNSCTPNDTEEFDEALLAGYWVTDSEFTGTPNSDYWYYNSDGTGYTWDSSEDISESEAQDFTWTLVGSTLRQIHNIQMGGNVPKTYTIQTLTAEQMIYSDNQGVTRTFTKTTKP